MIDDVALRRAPSLAFRCTGASRTDAGVHAVGQVAAFTSEREISVERLATALTARLPEDVQVRGAEIVDDDFDPMSRIKCWNHEKKRAVAGASAPQFQHLPAYLQKNPWMEIYDESKAPGAGKHLKPSSRKSAQGRRAAARHVSSAAGPSVSRPRRRHLEGQDRKRRRSSGDTTKQVR